MEHTAKLTKEDFECNKNGSLKNTAQNYLLILEREPFFDGLVYNSLSRDFEQNKKGEKTVWEEPQTAIARMYIESQYGIRSVDKFWDALMAYSAKHQYHPVRRVVERTIWDGEERCELFLTKWLRCEDTPYNREVSRLLFATGIHRLYRPGCKADTTTVLIGDQGCGKSTICRWLALSDDFFGEINTFEGKSSIEALQGIFIGEVAELLALTKVREQEAVKAFLTRQTDKGRMAYQKMVSSFPRQCIFIATTNKEWFLTDKTGGRRWLPVRVRSDPHELYEREAEVKADIAQCWAEALFKFRKDEMPPVPAQTLEADILEQQASVEEEDWRVGMIEAYLEGREEVCVYEIWERALHNYDKPQRKDSMEISMILKNLGWVSKHSARTRQYGKQRIWQPKSLPW